MNFGLAEAFIAFLDVCREGNSDAVWTLLKRSRTQYPSHILSGGLDIASFNGHLSVVEILLDDPLVDPSHLGNRPIISASMNGHFSIVEKLLLDSRIDPSDSKNAAFRAAFQNCQLLVVERLSRDPRVDHFLTDFHVIRPRTTDICIALQGLDLPALLTLAILDALIHNGVPMHIKWNLITTVKHFHK